MAAVVAISVASVAASYAPLGEPDSSDTVASPGSASEARYPDRVYGVIDAGNGSPMLGDPSAPVTIIEFGDYQCHFCALWYHDTSPRVKDDLVSSGKTNLVFVDFAFLGRDSPKAAQASYCADDQGMYWEYHGVLYESQQDRIDGGWASPANLRAFAVDLELDIDTFNECMSSQKYADRVAYNTRVATENGVEATPTFFVVGPDGGHVMIQGAHPYSTFARAVDSASTMAG